MGLAGSRGTIAVGLDERAPLISAEAGTGFPSEEPWQEFWSRFTPAYEAEIAAFIRLIQHGGEPACTVADALEAVIVAEAADRSMREQRSVEVAEIRAAV